MAQLHPFFTHFPIALLIVAAGFDLYAALKKQTQYRQTAFMLLIMASGSAILAAVSGNVAESALVTQSQVHKGVKEALESHVSWGNAMIWLIVIAAVGRSFALLEKKSWASEGWVFPLVSACLAILVVITGFLGGELTHEILDYFKRN